MRLLTMLLAISGLLADGFFITMSYKSEGTPIALSVFIAAMLTCFSAFLFINRDDKKYLVAWWFTFVYIVLMTHAGQFFMLQSNRIKTQTTIEVQQVNDNPQVSIIDNQIQTYKDTLFTTKQMISTIDKEKEPGRYRRYMNSLTDINDKIITLNEKKSQILIESSTKSEDKAKNLDRYSFYSFGNATLEKLLIIFFEIFFSVISAIIAPFCLSKLDKDDKIILPIKVRRKETEKKEKEEDEQRREETTEKNKSIEIKEDKTTGEEFSVSREEMLSSVESQQYYNRDISSETTINELERGTTAEHPKIEFNIRPASSYKDDMKKINKLPRSKPAVLGMMGGRR